MSGVAALVLAAGRSSRYADATGGANKLLADFAGKPLLRHAVDAALASRARPVVVVTGHDAAAIGEALAGLPLTFAHNPDFANGMASSIRRGLLALPADASGALMLLADMPLVGVQAIDRVIAAFEAQPSSLAIVPTVAGEWAHPVLIARLLFAELAALEGDAGARRLLRRRSDVATIELGDARLLADTDTPEAFAAALALNASSAPNR
jgi:molybdenum cofactor cytidylyltransferase